MVYSIALLACVACASAAFEWRVVDTNVLTTDIGIAFISPFVGYIAGDANGVGPAILKSTDGGRHFDSCNASFGIDALLLDVDAAADSVVVSSVFGELYSDNGGKTFQRSLGGGLSQSVRYIGLNGDGGHKYGVTGQYGRKQGVAISVNSGKTFSAYDAGLSTLARYGAFPTETTWYVAAGEWPDNSTSTAAPVKARHFRHGRTQLLKADGTLNLNSNPTPDNDIGYKAQITKTTDGGKTWSSVFFENNTFYFNGIDCSPNNENNCCAVGEADGTEGGGRIHCTADGGKTWTRNFWAPSTSTTHYSLLELRFSSDTDVWAVGGALTEVSPSAWFVHSTDGGKTWTPDASLLRGYYALGISAVSPNVAFAAVDNLITQSSGIAKYSNL